VRSRRQHKAGCETGVKKKDGGGGRQKDQKKERVKFLGGVKCCGKYKAGAGPREKAGGQRIACVGGWVLNAGEGRRRELTEPKQDAK